MPDGSVKLGFRAHYPQLETKLTVRGRGHGRRPRASSRRSRREVRKRLGNFILAEDEQTLEGVILAALTAAAGLRSRSSRPSRADRSPRASATCPARRRSSAAASWRATSPRSAPRVGLDGGPPAGELTRETAEAVAHAARRRTGASHALAVLIDLDDGPDKIDFGGTICLAIATADGAESRRSRILGGREWVRLGRHRDGARLPAPLSPGAAGGRANRLREDVRSRTKETATC